MKTKLIDMDGFKSKADIEKENRESEITAAWAKKNPLGFIIGGKMAKRWWHATPTIGELMRK